MGLKVRPFKDFLLEEKMPSCFFGGCLVVVFLFFPHFLWSGNVGNMWKPIDVICLYLYYICCVFLCLFIFIFILVY